MPSTSIYNDIDKLQEKFNRKTLGKNAKAIHAATPSPIPEPFTPSRQHRLKKDRDRRISGSWCQFTFGSQFS